METTEYRIPAVALRGMVVLPEMVTHFDVSRSRSIKAVEQALSQKQNLFRYFTHLQCPGCGVTHMLLELLHGNFREAYNSHPVLFLWGPFLLWLVLKSLYAYITDKDLRLRTWEKAGMYIFLVVLFVFFVYRNLP